MNDKLFLIPLRQAADFLGISGRTLLDVDRYKFHCPRIKEGSEYFFNEDDLIKFKEKRDFKKLNLIPKEPASNKQKIDANLQFKWDVFLLTKFFNSPEEKIYNVLSDFSKKHNLKIDFNDCPFLRSPFTGESYVYLSSDVYEFVATRLKKIFDVVSKKEVTDVFGIAIMLKGSSIDCIKPKTSLSTEIKKQAKKEQKNMDSKISIGRMFRENYNSSVASSGVKIRKMK